MIVELILSVNPVTPTKGTNAGTKMFVINGKHWSKSEPDKSDTHVCLEEVDGETKAGKKAKFINVVGYSKDTRATIASKIEMITAHDAAYSVAIASLLK